MESVAVKTVVTEWPGNAPRWLHIAGGIAWIAGTFHFVRFDRGLR